MQVFYGVREKFFGNDCIDVSVPVAWDEKLHFIEKHFYLMQLLHTATDEVLEMIDRFHDEAYGWKLAGADGGGYFILISDKDIPGTIDQDQRMMDFHHECHRNIN